jgi:hypothetical protein
MAHAAGQKTERAQITFFGCLYSRLVLVYLSILSPFDTAFVPTSAQS